MQLLCFIAALWNFELNLYCNVGSNYLIMNIIGLQCLLFSACCYPSVIWWVLSQMRHGLWTWQSLILCLMRCLHDPANVQQTFSKCIQNTRANAGRLLFHVNTLWLTFVITYVNKYYSVYFTVFSLSHYFISIKQLMQNFQRGPSNTNYCC